MDRHAATRGGREGPVCRGSGRFGGLRGPGLDFATESWYLKTLMLLTLMKCKLHRATVTQADLNYQGSIAIDSELLRAAGIVPYEQVHVYDVANGNRFVTYALDAPAESGVVCVNGAAARLVAPGDPVIVVAYAQMNEAEARSHKPKVLLMGVDNRSFQLVHQ
jgi:aspartate 1-decarboxylase